MERKGSKYLDQEENFVVHPDVADAIRNYHRGGFPRMFRERDEKVANGEPFWNTDHDEEMRQTAEERTNNAIAEGWKFPKRRKR